MDSPFEFDDLDSFIPGALGERHGIGIVTAIERRLGASRDADVRFVDLVAEDRRARRDVGTRRGATGKRANQPDGSESSSET